MQAVKNGIKCILRTPGKTALFTLILIVLAALLTVSFSVFGAVRGYIDDCGEYYRTIVELEYVGRDYPDKSVYDASLCAAVGENRAELDSLIASDGVISFEPASYALVSFEGAHRWDKAVYDPDAAVLEIRVNAYDEKQDMYTALVSKALYSRRDYTEKLILIRAGEDRLEASQKYVVTGRFFQGNTQNPWFLLQPLPFMDGGTQTELAPAAPIENEAAAPEGYLLLAEHIRKTNDSFRASYTASLGDLYPFHQQLLSLTDGRMFTEEEYAQKAHSAIISDRVAGLLEISVGDVIPLEVFSSRGDLFESSSLETVDGGDFEIVGVFKDNDIFPMWIFLPDADACSDEVTPVNGYTIGQFRLRNEAAADFMALTARLAENGFRFSLYDQGYSAATEPIRELMFISVVFLAVCLALAAAALALKSHLFISRQREAALTMLALGASQKHVFVYFLSAALVLTLAAAVVGCFIGRALEGRVMETLRDFASQFSDRDLRFSDSRLALIRTLEFDPKIPASVYFLSAAALIAGSALFTLAFTALSLQTKNKTARAKRVLRKSALKRAGRTSRLSGFFKYGLLSARRGTARTLAVILMGAVAAVFFSKLVSSAEGYRDQLDSYRDNAKITGFATDSTGRMIDGLAVKGSAIKELLGSGLVTDCSAATSLGHISPLGPARTSEGEMLEVPYRVPDTAFVFEAEFESIWEGAKWLAVSSLANNSIFHFTRAKDIEWCEGFDESVMLGDGPFCAMPKDMMEESGIRLGDIVRFKYAYYDEKHDNLMRIHYMDLKVIACYSSAAGNRIVFSPLAYERVDQLSVYLKEVSLSSRIIGYKIDEELVEVWEDWLSSALKLFPSEVFPTFEPPAYEEDPDPIVQLESGLNEEYTYGSFTFSLTDARRIDELREALSSCFTYVNSDDRTKNHAVLEDEIYLSTTQSMERQIQYVDVLYRALYVLAGIVGFVLAWLMTLSRRKEIAVMRALGTPPVRIALNIIAEQALLMLLGLAAGVGVSRLSGAGSAPLQLYLTAAFFALWCLACVICMISSLKKRSYAALTEPE